MGHQFEIPAITCSFTHYFRKNENFWKKSTGKAMVQILKLITVKIEMETPSTC
jgi:hypothetical protein